MNKENALFLGRFQPPSTAHLETVQSILVQWKHLTIAVIYNTLRPAEIPPQWDDQLMSEDTTAYASPKNPLSSAEVSRLWRGCLETVGLLSRVAVVETKRPQFYPFNERFPSDRFDWVALTLSSISAEEATRRRMYEKMFCRKIHEVTPAFQLHNTEIKKLVRQGRQWSEFVPRGAYEIFLEINGPSRLLAS